MIWGYTIFGNTRTGIKFWVFFFQFGSYPILTGGATLSPTGLGPGWLVFWWELALVCWELAPWWLLEKSIRNPIFQVLGAAPDASTRLPTRLPEKLAVQSKVLLLVPCLTFPASKSFCRRSSNDPWDQQNCCSNWRRLAMKIETHDLRHEVCFKPFYSRF